MSNRKKSKIQNSSVKETVVETSGVADDILDVQQEVSKNKKKKKKGRKLSENVAAETMEPKPGPVSAANTNSPVSSSPMDTTPIVNQKKGRKLSKGVAAEAAKTMEPEPGPVSAANTSTPVSSSPMDTTPIVNQKKGRKLSKGVAAEVAETMEPEPGPVSAANTNSPVSSSPMDTTPIVNQKKARKLSKDVAAEAAKTMEPKPGPVSAAKTSTPVSSSPMDTTPIVNQKKGRKLSKGVAAEAAETMEPKPGLVSAAKTSTPVSSSPMDTTPVVNQKNARKLSKNVAAEAAETMEPKPGPVSAAKTITPVSSSPMDTTPVVNQKNGRKLSKNVAAETMEPEPGPVSAPNTSTPVRSTCTDTTHPVVVKMTNEIQTSLRTRIVREVIAPCLNNQMQIGDNSRAVLYNKIEDYQKNVMKLLDKDIQSAVLYFIFEPGSVIFSSRKIPLPKNRKVKIGCATKNAVESDRNGIFECAILDNFHALIWYDDNHKFWIMDNCSKNGVYVNNIDIELEPYELHNDDVIMFKDISGARLMGRVKLVHGLSRLPGEVGFSYEEENLILRENINYLERRAFEMLRYQKIERNTMLSVIEEMSTYRINSNRIVKQIYDKFTAETMRADKAEAFLLELIEKDNDELKKELMKKIEVLEKQYKDSQNALKFAISDADFWRKEVCATSETRINMLSMLQEMTNKLKNIGCPHFQEAKVNGGSVLKIQNEKEFNGIAINTNCNDTVSGCSNMDVDVYDLADDLDTSDSTIDDYFDDDIFEELEETLKDVVGSLDESDSVMYKSTNDNAGEALGQAINLLQHFKQKTQEMSQTIKQIEAEKEELQNNIDKLNLSLYDDDSVLIPGKSYILVQDETGIKLVPENSTAEIPGNITVAENQNDQRTIDGNDILAEYEHGEQEMNGNDILTGKENQKLEIADNGTVSGKVNEDQDITDNNMVPEKLNDKKDIAGIEVGAENDYKQKIVGNDIAAEDQNYKPEIAGNEIVEAEHADRDVDGIAFSSKAEKDSQKTEGKGNGNNIVAQNQEDVLGRLPGYAVMPAPLFQNGYQHINGANQQLQGLSNEIRFPYSIAATCVFLMFWVSVIQILLEYYFRE